MRPAALTLLCNLFSAPRTLDSVQHWLESCRRPLVPAGWHIVGTTMQRCNMQRRCACTMQRRCPFPLLAEEAEALKAKEVEHWERAKRLGDQVGGRGHACESNHAWACTG